MRNRCGRAVPAEGDAPRGTRETDGGVVVAGRHARLTAEAVIETRDASVLAQRAAVIER
jgi:hypothetical protein